ncbi:OLC1v1024425C1 [Oldenlandia corymbosa var. corymbosa]|uniref:OLC1v1024425C1 n=1 Tax=Oldenlandia corymbosa var. corymbosa TaxID=529605 RepID=A0AAV1C2G3_OLDCO|nr:OLC1v1024425C1 [Oldenlandia corymbosa var. corymbosa]
MSGESGEKAGPVSDTVDGGEGEATEGNSGGGGTTMAAQKKRLRRVSFAEMTSVHFFDRDEEDNDTPKEQLQSAGKGGNGDVEKEEILGFLQMMDSKGEDEEGEAIESEEDDEEQAAMQRPFLKLMESPSSGSGFGSATSNDEDFFGPVSASFIRRGCLSDSEASDDNCDVTMDSTAFSMHFRSIARSESGVELKTPTGLHLSFEDKPSTQTTVGNTMELTVSRKLLSTTSSPAGKRSANSNTSDMSLVGESPSKYDYGKLSPELDALLAEGTKIMMSDSRNSAALDSPRNLGNASFPLRENLSVASEDPNNSGDMPFAPQENLVDLVDLIGNNKKAVDSLQGQPGDANGHGDIPHESPSAEFISSPSRQRKIPASSALPVNMSFLTPQQGDSSLCKEVDYCRSTSSIQKSISKLNLLEASPFSASIDSRFKDLNIKSQISKPSPFKIQLEREMKNFLPKHIDASFRSVESQLLFASAKKGAQISEAPADNSNVLDEVDRENIRRTEESNAAGVSSSPFSGRKGSSGTLGQLVTSPESQKKLTVYREHQNLNDLVLPDQFANLESSGLKENGSSVNLSTEPLDRLESFPVRTRLHFGSPVVNLKDNRDMSTFDNQNVSQLIENHETHMRENISQLTNSGDLDASLHPCIVLPESTSNLLREEPQSAPSGGAVPFTESIKELTFPQKAVETFPSASKKEFPLTGKKHMDPHHVVDYSAPTFNALKSPRKRSEILDFDDSEHHSVVSVQQRSPKLRKVVVLDSQMLGGFNEDCRETNMIALGSKKWTDIYFKFSEDGERLPPSSVDRLKLSLIDSFEDVLHNLKKAKTYGMLCSEIFHQKTSISNDLRSERVGEIRLLLHQFIHEKSKLQLIFSKKKLLLEKLQQISSGVQDMQMLKMNILPKFVGASPAGARGLLNFISMMKHSAEDTNEKVAALKQSLESLNKKKANLVKALRSYCKLKEEQSHSDCVLLANDNLMKKSCHRFIRLGMQIWGIEKVRNNNDNHEIFVNYLGFVIQSFKFAGCPASSFVISNKMDDVNIIKSFPNMDACEAFSSVLNAETTQKYLGSQSLARETQAEYVMLPPFCTFVGRKFISRQFGRCGSRTSVGSD